MDDNTEAGGGEAGGSGLGASFDYWPEDDEAEIAPRRQLASDHGAGSSAAPTARGGVQKRRAASGLFGSRPKKPKSRAAATRRDEAAAKAARFRKVVKQPQTVSAFPLSLERIAAASVVGSAGGSANTRRVDPRAELQAAMERNAREARE
ncbi:uncharacterized protein [Aegilops tauschii subsp. strangulata]|uniref:uncharacterized protein n=1 Tax=Aegilops tauschii subsp. strangulata TaxID=200361 RepID=UPI003CC87524